MISKSCRHQHRPAVYPFAGQAAAQHQIGGPVFRIWFRNTLGSDWRPILAAAEGAEVIDSSADEDGPALSRRR